LGAGDVRTTERADDNVVVTLRRDDISGVTTPLGDAEPALAAGDVRTTERADDIIYFARERKAPPGYAPVDVNEWHGLEPPPDAILKWRDDYPHLAPMVCNSSGELINCIYLCDVADPVQAELDRAAGIKPEQLYCWLSSREINERPGGAIIPYARQLWRERGYSRRHLQARSASEGRPPAPPTTTAPTSKDRMMADRMIPPRTEQQAPTSAALPTAAPRSRVGLKDHRRSRGRKAG
jgi:hypothetical protein